MFTFDKVKIISVLILIVSVFASGFLIGQKITMDYYKLEIKQLENKALQLENEYLVKKIDTEKELKNKVSEVLTNAETQKDSIDTAFNDSLNRLQSNGSDSNKMQLPDNAGTTAGSKQAGKDKRYCDNGKDFKRLSKQLLEQAKEYDLLKVKYNTLLSLWQETESRINNFD